MNDLYIFIVLGPIELLIGIILFIKRKIFVSKSKLIIGTVIDIKEGYISNKKYYHPVIKYYDEFNRKSISFNSNIN